MKTIILFFILIISNLVYASDLPDFPFIVSTGVAEKDVTPDIATIGINVHAFNQESSLALKSTNVASDKIIKLLKKYKIDISQLEAGDIQKSAIRQRDDKFNQLNILGYNVSRHLTLNLVNLSKYAELMNDLVSINNVINLNSQFNHSNRDVIESELVILASKKAKDSAKQIANSLDKEIHSVYAVSQISNFDNFLATFGASAYSIEAKHREDYSFNEEAAMFIPKAINISQHINVVFRLK